MPVEISSDDGERVRGYLARHDADCPRCAYNLRGLNEPRCPECGSPIDPEWLFDAAPPAGFYRLWVADWRLYLGLNILLAAGTWVGILITGEWHGILVPRAGTFPRPLDLFELGLVFLPIYLWRCPDNSSGAPALLGGRTTARLLCAAPFVCAAITILHALAFGSVWW